jgi:microcystin-dependent protein
VGGYLTPDTINPAKTLRLVMVSLDLHLWGAVTDAIDALSDVDNWQEYGAKTPEEIAAYFFDVAWDEREMSLVGVIFDFAGGVVPAYALACDGATYNRVDYPLLYATLDSSFIVDANTFNVPDFRDRTIVGAGSNHAVGDIGGAETHTLAENEMPSHSHTDTGHTHTEITATPVVVTIGAGAPVPSAVPSVGVTGAGFAGLTNTGGGGAHNNMQPFGVARKIIIAF